jgi:LacI family transcriptional regulator
MVDVAHAAGVSVTTVSYVIGGRRGDHAAARISDETRRRVAHAVEAIGYRVNEPARNLRRNRTDRVVLLMDRLSSPYDQLLASELETSLDATGRSLSIMVCTSLERIEVALGMVRQGHADGAIVQSRIVKGWQSLMERYAADHIPMVALSNVLQPRGFDVVSNDEEPAILAAIDSLVAKGHQRFGFLAHTVDPELPDPRMVIARQRLREHDLHLPEEMIVTGARDRNMAFNAVQHMLLQPGAPTALISASDTGAISALWAAHSLQRTVPGDIAIIGCGNVAECLVTVPQLSSAGPARPDFSPVAGLLLDRLDNPRLTENRHLRMPWEYFPRGSS